MIYNVKIDEELQNVLQKGVLAAEDFASGKTPKGDIFTVRTSWERSRTGMMWAAVFHDNPNKAMEYYYFGRNLGPGYMHEAMSKFTNNKYAPKNPIKMRGIIRVEKVIPPHG